MRKNVETQGKADAKKFRSRIMKMISRCEDFWVAERWQF